MPTFFWILYAAFLLSQVFIAVRYITTGNKLYFKTLLVTNVLLGLYVAAEAVFTIGVPYLIRCLVIIALFIHTFFGYFKDRYTRSQTFDRYLHAFGSFAYALFFYTLFVQLFSAAVSPKAFAAVMVTLTGITAGAIFEIVEFSIDKKMPVKTQHGLIDTDMDLLFDVVGSFAAGVAAYFLLT